MSFIILRTRYPSNRIKREAIRKAKSTIWSGVSILKRLIPTNTEIDISKYSSSKRRSRAAEL